MTSLLESNRSSAPLLWAAALGFSLLAHVGLFRMNPNLLAGSGGLPEAPAVRLRPDVRVAAPEPERIRSELPELLDRFQAEEEPPAADEPGVFPEAPELSGPSVDPTLPPVETEVNSAALSEWSPEAPPPSTWTPREEVLAVTDQRVTETLEVLPRMFREVDSTRPGAPDVTLPVESWSLEDAGALRTPELTIFSSSSSGSGGAVPALGLGGGMPGVPEKPVEIPLPPEIFDEPVLPETSGQELIATEDLLQLSVRVFDPEDEPQYRYVKLQLIRNGIESLPMLPRDVIFLIDCSASMTEAKLQLALEGVRRALETIEDPDRVQVIAFRDRVELFPSSPQAATVFTKAQVRTFLSTLRARGQTDVYASLQALNRKETTPGRPALALLITDGVPTQGVQDTREILERFSRENEGRVSVFGLGGGDRVNHQLLDFLSFRNRGFSLISPLARGLQTVIPDLATELRRPVLTDLEVAFTGAGSAGVYPRSLSHLYVDRPWILVGRFPRATERIGFQVVGSSADARHDIVFPVNLSAAPSGGDSLRMEWAWQAGLEVLADAITQGTQEAFREGDAFFRRYRLEIPEAYRN